jgi:arylsulfatase A-like enzyme
VVQAEILDKGARVNNFFLTTPVCCPSRASVLRGQYPHNTGIFYNTYPDGGWQSFDEYNLEHNTAGTVLQAAGYRTAMVGKWMNGYGPGTTVVPPGWSRWVASGSLDYFGYKLNVDGTIVQYGDEADDYHTDVIAQYAENFVASTPADKPLFLYFSIRNPHGPLVPAPRHANLFPDAKAPRPPSFNETDVSDKPQYIRDFPPLTQADEATIDANYRVRLQMLQAADEAVAQVLDALASSGRLNNTYIFFTSDNGYHNGEHRIPLGKGRPYEESFRFPLYVRGPGIVPGFATPKLAANIDLLPTWADIANVDPPNFVDGRSLLPLVQGQTVAWRSAVLGEGHARNPTGRNPEWFALRMPGKVYVEYGTGEKEYYDLATDPYQTKNAYDSLDPATQLAYAQRLDALKSCSANTCRVADTP